MHASAGIPGRSLLQHQVKDRHALRRHESWEASRAKAPANPAGILTRRYLPSHNQIHDEFKQPRGCFR